MTSLLSKDPLNLIFAGVGGQGNVMASRLLARMLSLAGCEVTIGETFGMSQRGGSVMSQVRISGTSIWSPQVPFGHADIVVALEPVEALRVMQSYGNSRVSVVSNSRPVQPTSCIGGDFEYPEVAKIEAALRALTPNVWMIDATEEAKKLGNPIMSNVVMIGALCGLNVLPVDTPEFERVAPDFFPEKVQAVNRKAFEVGRHLILVTRAGSI